ncbi:MAG: hypothetical protein K8R23_06690 [Chthoniobacter sp.]|nr:hypothetical protein [Chthoniobacter sp.]
MTKDEEERLILVRRFKLRYRRLVRKAGWSLKDDLKPAGGFSGVFSTWGRVARAGISLIALADVVLVFVRMLPWAMKEVDVSFGDNGAIRLHVPGEKVEWMTGVAASKLWYNTRIKIPPGGAVTLEAWGVVNLAVHRLVTAAIDDTIPHQPWVGPHGVTLGANGADVPKKDTAREKLILHRKEGELPRYGLLLACLVPSNAPDSDRPGKHNPRPSKFHIYEFDDKDDPIRNSSSETCELWLVVNDVVLDEKNPESGKLYIETVKTEIEQSRSYTATDEFDNAVKTLEEEAGKLGDTGVPPSEKLMWSKILEILKGLRQEATRRKTAEQRWNYIEEKGYWDLWYDDNMGEFQVKCTVK